MLGVGFLGKISVCFFYLSQYGPFVLCCGKVVQLVYRFFFRKDGSLGSYRFDMDMICSGSSYIPILDDTILLSIVFRQNFWHFLIVITFGRSPTSFGKNIQRSATDI